MIKDISKETIVITVDTKIYIDNMLKIYLFPYFIFIDILREPINTIIIYVYSQTDILKSFFSSIKNILSIQESRL